MNAIEKRVAKGVKLLNRSKPGWQKLVKLPRVSMGSLDNCILGQVFRNRTKGESWKSFGEGCISLGITMEDAWKYGFEAKIDEDDLAITRQEKYTELKATWKNALTK